MPFTTKPPTHIVGGSSISMHYVRRYLPTRRGASSVHFRRSSVLFILLATWCLLVLGCAKSPEGSDGSGDGAADETVADGVVVATYDGGQVTVDEVDQRVLSLPAAERPKPGERLDAWFEDQIREMVVDRRLLEDAETSGLAEQTEFQQAALDARKQIRLELCLGEWLPEPEPITVERLQAAYDEDPVAFRAPEARLVYQIFLRPEPEAALKIRSIRERVLRGEGFLRMAREHSESENRHQEGLVGWVRRGQLPDLFEDVVFRLEEGVPSRPLETDRGHFLFYVEQILPERTVTFEEAAPKLRERLLAERTEVLLQALDEETPSPEGSELIDRQALTDLVRAGDPSAVVLRMPGVERTLGDLRSRLDLLLQQEQSAARSRSVPTLELAWRVLEQVRRREEFSHRCDTEDLVAGKVVEERFATWRESALISAQRQRLLSDLALQDEERLRLFYESNLGNFSRPPTWTLKRLRVPLGDRPLERMARLEQAARDDAPGLEALGEELGGDVDDLGQLSLADIRRLQHKLPARIAPLRPGQLAAPYRTEAGLELVAVVDTTPTEAIPLEEIRRRVASAYVQQYTAELYDELQHSVLEPLGLEIRPEGLEALELAARDEAEISVEELEKLLEEM